PAPPTAGVGLGALDGPLLEELERLKREPIDAEELARAQQQIEASFVWAQDSISSRAATLARFERMGSWRRADEYVASIRAVTAADVQRVARTYFPVDRKTVGVLLPEAPAGGPGSPEKARKEP